MLEKIPILKKLRALEQQAGKDVTLKKSPEGGEKADRPRREPMRDPKRDLKGPSERPKEGRAGEEKRGGRQREGHVCLSLWENQTLRVMTWEMLP